MNNITYDKFLSFKNDIKEFDEDLIKQLELVAQNIKSLDLNTVTSFKDKFWNKRVIKSGNKIITLLNILTETNINEIFDKIVQIDIMINELDTITDHIHKKCCNEYQMLNIYIIIINKIVHSGLYSFNKNIFWSKFIDIVQNTFINTELIEQNIQIFTGNILLIFYLCKNKLLSLKVLDSIFLFFEKNFQNENVINLIFKIIDKIPVFYNDYFIKKITKFLELEIPFRIKFKFKNLLLIFDEKTYLQNKLTDFLNDYKKNIVSTNDLNKLLQELPNFRKTLFFKMIIIDILKSDLSDNQIKSLIQFIFKKRYKPMNYKKILTSIKKELYKIKKKNKSCEDIYNKILNRYYVNK
jgi:hypothetical protein